MPSHFWDARHEWDNLYMQYNFDSVLMKSAICS